MLSLSKTNYFRKKDKMKLYCILRMYVILIVVILSSAYMIKPSIAKHSVKKLNFNEIDKVSDNPTPIEGKEKLEILTDGAYSWVENKETSSLGLHDYL